MREQGKPRIWTGSKYQKDKSQDNQHTRANKPDVDMKINGNKLEQVKIHISGTHDNRLGERRKRD